MMARGRGRFAGLAHRINWSSVRVRSTVLAALSVTVVLVVAEALTLAAYANRLEGDLDTTLRQQAELRAALIEDGRSPIDLAPALTEESMVWIGTPEGQAIAVDGSMIPLEPPPLVDGFPVPGDTVVNGEIRLLVEERYGEGFGLVSDDQKSDDGESDDQDDDEHDERESENGEVESHRLRIAAASVSDGALLVVVGAEDERILQSVASLSTLLLVGLPPLVLLVGALVWFTTGRALRPVEHIREQAASISGASLGDRVPVPEGTDEIHDLAVTVNEMLDRLEAHDRSLRQFTADASHELKSPVANVRALIETSGLQDPAWPALRDRLTGETDRLQDLVSNLLYLAARDAGRPQSTPEVVALDELVFREAEVAAATGSVVVDLSGVEPATVVGVETELYRLVRNLVDNGLRHAEARLALAIDSEQSGRVCLTVGDDGPGVAPEHRELVFERFTRLDEARARHQGGAGLGLAIVRQVALDHGAEVEVDWSPLGGAQFRVCFPGGG